MMTEAFSHEAQEVDFLPETYHKRRRSRRIKVWRGSLLATAVLLSLIGSAQQYWRHRELSSTRDMLQQQVANSFSQLGGAEAKRRQIESLKAEADLVAHLQICVPPSRLLHVVTANLPPNVSLTQFALSRSPIARNSTRQRPSRRSPAADQAEDQKSPAQRDLEKLQSERQTSVLRVTLKGIAPDDLSVSAYLAGLQQTAMFDHIQPLFTDEIEYRDLQLRVFSVLLDVRSPGVFSAESVDPKVARETRYTPLPIADESRAVENKRPKRSGA